MSNDYARGVEDASGVYKAAIRDYMIENDKLRLLVVDMLNELDLRDRYGFGYYGSFYKERAKALGIDINRQDLEC